MIDGMVERLSAVIAEGVGRDDPSDVIARAAIEAMREPIEGVRQRQLAGLLSDEARETQREMWAAQDALSEHPSSKEIEG